MSMPTSHQGRQQPLIMTGAGVGGGPAPAPMIDGAILPPVVPGAKEVIMTPEQAAKVKLAKGYAYEPILPVAPTPEPQPVDDGDGIRTRRRKHVAVSAPSVPVFQPTGTLPTGETPDDATRGQKRKTSDSSRKPKVVASSGGGLERTGVEMDLTARLNGNGSGEAELRHPYPLAGGWTDTAHCVVNPPEADAGLDKKELKRLKRQQLKEELARLARLKEGQGLFQAQPDAAGFGGEVIVSPPLDARTPYTKAPGVTEIAVPETSLQDKAKRTPKANTLYHNSQFLSGNDKIPPMEKPKPKKTSSGKKGSKEARRQKLLEDHEARMRDVFKKAQEVVRSLMNLKEGKWFSRPVDPATDCAPDYFKVIKKPMDLGTVIARLDRNDYGTVDDVREDVVLVFRNAQLYNPQGHFLHVVAKDFERQFEKKWGSIVAKLQQVEQRFQEEDRNLDFETSGGLAGLAGLVGSPGTFAPIYGAGQDLTALTRQLSMLSNQVSTLSQLALTGGKVGGGVGGARGSGAPKRAMKFEEKQRLSESLSQLPEDKVVTLVNIITTAHPELAPNNDEEIELDFDKLDNETLWKLDRYVKGCLKAPQPKKKAGPGGGSTGSGAKGGKKPSPRPVAGQSDRKGARKAGDEEDELDIGVDMPLEVDAFPSVMIERDSQHPAPVARAAKEDNGSSSGSSSMGDSSSSDSASSDSSSDEDPALNPPVEGVPSQEGAGSKPSKDREHSGSADGGDVAMSKMTAPGQRLCNVLDGASHTTKLSSLQIVKPAIKKDIVVPNASKWSTLMKPDPLPAAAPDKAGEADASVAPANRIEITRAAPPPHSSAHPGEGAPAQDAKSPAANGVSRHKRAASEDLDVDVEVDVDGDEDGEVDARLAPAKRQKTEAAAEEQSPVVAAAPHPVTTPAPAEGADAPEDDLWSEFQTKGHLKAQQEKAKEEEKQRLALAAKLEEAEAARRKEQAALEAVAAEAEAARKAEEDKRRMRDMVKAQLLSIKPTGHSVHMEEQRQLMEEMMTRGGAGRSGGGLSALGLRRRGEEEDFTRSPAVSDRVEAGADGLDQPQTSEGTGVSLGSREVDLSGEDFPGFLLRMKAGPDDDEDEDEHSWRKRPSLDASREEGEHVDSLHA
eukprot:jgi/Mesvir1/8157/Mv12467-RA.1